MLFLPKCLPQKQPQNAPKILLGNKVLALVDTFKLLGMTYDKNGHFKTHFKKCFKKAGKILVSPQTALKLYTLLFRPHFEYCLQVLPLKEILVKKIKGFQRRETKSLLGLPMSTQKISFCAS